MEDMEYYVQNCVCPVASLIPDSMFPANYAQKGSIKGLFYMDAGEQIAEFHGGEVFNMVPPSATALLRGVPLFAASEGVDVSEENGMVRVRATGTAAHAARPEGGLSAIHRLATALLEAGVLTGQSEAAMRGVAALSGDIYGERAGIACEDADTGRSTMVCGMARMENGKLSLSVDCRLSIATNVEGDSETLQAYGRSLGLRPREFSTTSPVCIPKDGPLIAAIARHKLRSPATTRRPHLRRRHLFAPVKRHHLRRHLPRRAPAPRGAARHPRLRPRPG